MFTRRQLILGSIAAAAHAHAQQLAHAGWRGNSITPEAWWKHATFVRCVAPLHTFAGITQALDAFVEVAADSILLPDLLNKTRNADGGFDDDPPHPLSGLFLQEFGTEDELDTLLREASARRMHVLLTMPIGRATRDPAAVRFWMNRGIAGFDLGSVSDADYDALRNLRASLDHAPGQRILIASTTLAFDPRRRDPLTLHIAGGGGTGAPNQMVEVASLERAAVAADAPASQLPGAVPNLSSLLILLGGGIPILDSRLLESKEDRDDVKQVMQVRNTHPSLRNAVWTRLTDTDDSFGRNAWLVRARNGRETFLVAVNKGKTGATLHLSAALAAQHQHGTYVHPLLRSDGGMGSVNVETGVLPAGAAIVGELHADSDASPAAVDPDATPPGAAPHRHRRHRRK